MVPWVCRSAGLDSQFHTHTQTTVDNRTANHGYVTMNMSMVSQPNPHPTPAPATLAQTHGSHHKTLISRGRRA